MPTAVTDRERDHPVYRFGDFELDVARGVLLRAGVEIPLRQKSWQLLEYLVSHPQQLVTKDELMMAIWAPAVVTDGALTQCVIDVRRALGDVDHQIVKTVPRRGLRFDLAVECSSATQAAVDSTAPRRPPRTTWPRLPLHAALAVGLVYLIWWGLEAWLRTEATPIAAEPQTPPLAAPPLERVLVGLFVSRSNDPAAVAFAERARTDVISRLSGVRSVDVVDFERSTVGDVELSASVERANGTIRTEVRVTHLGDGEVLWTQLFDQPVDHLHFDKAALVALAVEGVIRTRHIVSRLPDHISAEARREFAHGHQEWWLWALGAGGNTRVVGEHLRRAIQLEPELWPAHAQLVIHYSNRFELDQPLPAYVFQAHRAARALMALEGREAEYGTPVQWEFPVALLLKRLDLDLDYAERLLKIAKSKGFPAGQVNAELGRLHALRGETDTAITWFQAAIARGAEINQSSALWDLGNTLLVAGQYARAREVLDRAVAHTVRGSEMDLIINRTRIMAYHFAGDRAGAAEILDQVLAQYRLTRPTEFVHVLALLGRLDEARDLLHEIETEYHDLRLPQITTAMLACYFLGDIDQTLLWMQRAVEIRDRRALPFLRSDSFMAPIRHEPRYAEVLQQFAAIEAAGSSLRPEIDAMLGTEDSM